MGNRPRPPGRLDELEGDVGFQFLLDPLLEERQRPSEDLHRLDHPRGQLHLLAEPGLLSGVEGIAVGAAITARAPRVDADATDAAPASSPDRAGTPLHRRPGSRASRLEPMPQAWYRADRVPLHNPAREGLSTDRSVDLATFRSHQQDGTARVFDLAATGRGRVSWSGSRGSRLSAGVERCIPSMSGLSPDELLTGTPRACGRIAERARRSATVCPRGVPRGGRDAPADVVTPACMPVIRRSGPRLLDPRTSTHRARREQIGRDRRPRVSADGTVTDVLLHATDRIREPEHSSFELLSTWNADAPHCAADAGLWRTRR